MFSGLGKLQDPYDICLKPNVTPVVHPPRRVPLALHARLKQKLDDMEKSGVIKKTDKPTEWVNSLVVVEKRDGSLRLCLDLKDSAIMREHRMLSTSQDVVNQLAGKKLFTVLDQKDSYWQIPLTERSSELCTHLSVVTASSECRSEYPVPVRYSRRETRDCLATYQMCI